VTRPSTPVSPAVVSEIERDRVLRLLDECRAPVVVVSAPAGAGKSILARQWTARSGRPHATVRLAGHLDDPVALSEVLLDALETLGPRASETRARLTGEEPAFSASLLPSLARIVSSRPTAFVLVLDDAHLVRSARAQQVIECVCDACPDGSTVVLLSRSQAPEWLARVRATGRLAEVSARDLEFDVDETARLLAAMGVQVGPAEAEAILEHTEGWPVGVYLTALSLRSGERVPADVGRLASGSDPIVADYLRTQVLATLSEDHRRFLTRSALLEELSGPLCDAVLERADSASVLVELHRQIQLVISTDPERRRFRYHHLLAEQLAADLQTYEAASVPGLHERASRWFGAQGDRESAIRHATASGNTDLVASLVWPAVPGCVASGNLDRLRVWLSSLTDDAIAGDRWLTLAAAWLALQLGDAPAMTRWSRIAEGHAGPEWRDSAVRDPYAATLAVLYAVVGSGGLEGSRDLCERAMQGLPPDSSFRAAAAFNRGVALTLQRDLPAALESLAEAEALGASLDVPVIHANAKSWMGLMALSAGERERGMRLISEAAEVTRAHHVDLLATGALTVTAQALVLAMLGDKSAAVPTLGTARRLSGVAGRIAPWFAVTGRVVQARTAILLGDGATARLLVHEAREHLTPELQASAACDGLEAAESALAHMSERGGAAGVLTSTELRVLQFLPSYLTLQQIGEHLFISQSTVKTHVLSIYRKFGVNSRAEAVKRGRDLGLVESPVAD
jgi:LuxR family transcriptional regulator, maltose regulon positive regulatory protein